MVSYSQLDTSSISQSRFSGGASACVTAGRLAAADPNLRILVLEAGPHTNGLPDHQQPARYLTHLRPGSKTMTFHAAKPSEELAGRSVIIPCAHCVGGGSSVNCKPSRHRYGPVYLLIVRFASHDVHSGIRF